MNLPPRIYLSGPTKPKTPMQIASTVLAYIIVSSLLAVAVAVLLWLVSFLVKEALLNFDEARDLLKTFSTNPARE